VISNYVRSLIAADLSDVNSRDEHTVQPRNSFESFLPNEKPVSDEVVDNAGCIFEPFCRRLQDCCISRPAKTLRSSAFTSETAQNTNPSRSQCETL